MGEEIQEMIDYIKRDIIRRSDIQLSEDTPLVSSGLVDSLALVEILMKLEDVTHTRISAGKVQPKDMDTIGLMFATAAKVGKPRN